MKNFKLLWFAVGAFMCISSINAQDVTDASLTSESSLTSLNDEVLMIDDNAGSWLLTFGVNVIDDDGARDLGMVFENTSSHFSNPLMLGAAYDTGTNFSYYTNLSFNKYIAEKIVDSGIIQADKEAEYFSFDVSAKYSFKEMLNTNVFDPYIVAGPGYTTIGEHTRLFEGELTTIPSIGRLTLNYGLGTNFWVSDSWGINLNMIAKNGIKQKTYKAEITNQVQFSLGGVYRISAKN